MADAKNIRLRDNRKPGWFWIDNGLLDQHGAAIGPHGIAVYAALARFSDSNGECFPSTATIARVTGLSRATVSTTLAELCDEKRQIVSVTRERGRVNVYRLLPLPQIATQPVNVVDRLPSDLSTTLTGVVNDVDRGCQRGRQGLSTTLTKVVNHVDTNKTQLTRPTELDPTQDDDDRSLSTSSSSPAMSDLDSWDALIEKFGQDAVIHAMRVASNPGKRHDLRYVRGVLLNLAKRGEAPMGGSRSTPTAAPVSAAGANGAEDQPAPMPAAPVNPVWGLVLDQMSSRVPPSVYKMFLAQSDVDCADGQPVVHLGNEYGVAWVPNRLGPELGRLWRDAGGAGELRYEV